jgi:hypothetical protein
MGVAVAAERRADRFHQLATGRRDQSTVAMVAAAEAAGRRMSPEGETGRWDELAAAPTLSGRQPTSPARCPAGSPATPAGVEPWEEAALRSCGRRREVALESRRDIAMAVASRRRQEEHTCINGIESVSRQNEKRDFRGNPGDLHAACMTSVRPPCGVHAASMRPDGHSCGTSFVDTFRRENNFFSGWRGRPIPSRPAADKPFGF